MTNRNNSVVLGIDIGTTNIKIVVASPQGRVLNVYSEPTEIKYLGKGISEFVIDDMEKKILDLLSAISRELPSVDSVVGIGIDSIGESMVGLDRYKKVITPCPTWFDRRTKGFLKKTGLEKSSWYDITGMVVDDIYSIWRIMWMREQENEKIKTVKHWMNVADYIVYKLSGEFVASPSLAARTGLFDRNESCWSPTLLEISGISEDSLPRIVPQTTVGGVLRKEIAEATGLKQGIPIVHAGHDHPCAGVGCGMWHRGQFMDSAGTSEALKTLVSSPLSYFETRDGRYDCYPNVLPGGFILSGHIPSSGLMLDWVVNFSNDVVEPGRPDKERFFHLIDKAADSGVGAHGVKVVPFLSGTGAPYNNRNMRASIHGLGTDSTSSDVMRATLEGTAFWLYNNLTLMKDIAGLKSVELIGTGGGAQNMLWTRIKSTMLHLDYVVPHISESAALGAAIIASLAIGAINGIEDAIEISHVDNHFIKPEESMLSAYQSVIKEYQELYFQLGLE